MIPSRPGFVAGSSTTGDSMTADSHVDDRDPLERTELVRRLRRMSWTTAAPAVKQRVFERVSAHARALGD